MRYLRRLAALSFAAAAGLTCTDAGTGPASRVASSIALQPQLAPAAAAAYTTLAQMGITPNNVRVVLTRGDGRAVLDTTVVIPSGATELSLALPVLTEVADEEFKAKLQLRIDALVLFEGSALVRAGSASSPTSIATPYVGPGATVKRLVLAPADTSMSAAATLQLRAKGLDAENVEVSTLYLGWSVDDATLGAVSETGLLSPSGKRGRIRVTAKTPNGILADANVNLVPAAARVLVESGGDQTAFVGQALPQPVRLQVQATDGLASPGVAIALRAISGGGSITPSPATSDGNGRIEASIVLGRTAGPQSFGARIVGTDIEAIFDIVAKPAPAAALAVALGDGQAGTVGTAAALPLVVRVTNTLGDLAPGAVVDWQVVSGGGTLASAQSASGSDGNASMTYTYGQAAGPVIVKASLPNTGATASFTLHALAGAPATMDTVRGTQFRGTAGTTLQPPLPAVLVRDAFGNPVPLASVALSLVTATGEEPKGTVPTNADGIAEVPAMSLPTTAGSLQVKAAVQGVAPVIFTIVVEPAAPARYNVSASKSAPAPGETITLVAQLKDTHGNIVRQAGRTVNWFSTNGGSFSAPASTTDAQGIATVTFTASASSAVTHELKAKDAADAAIFGVVAVTTTGGSIPAVVTIVSGDAQSAVVNTQLAAPLVVELRDAQGRPIAGYTISWSSNGGKLGGNTSSAATSITDVLGRTQVSYVVPSVAVATTVTATATPGIATTFTATARPGAPVQLQLFRSPNVNVNSGEPFSTQPIIAVVDQYGNHTPEGAGRVVTVTTLQAGIMVAGGSATAAADGQAAFSALAISGSPGSVTLLFRSDSLTQVSAAVQIAAPTFTVAPRDSTTFSIRAGELFGASRPAITVRSAQGAPAVGVAVTFDRLVNGVVAESWNASVDSTGVAAFPNVNLPTEAGTVLLRTAVDGGSSVDFTVQVTPSLLGLLEIVDGDRQSVPAGGTLPKPLVVRATDYYGNVIPGAPVLWKFWYGSGSFTTVQSVTDSSGLASTTATISAAGGVTIRAEGGETAANVQPRLMLPERSRLEFRTMRTPGGPVRVYERMVRARRVAARTAGTEVQAYEGGYAAVEFVSLGIPAGVSHSWMGDADSVAAYDSWNRAQNWRTATGGIATTAPGGPENVFIPTSYWTSIPHLQSNVAVALLLMEQGAEVELADFRLEVTQGGIKDLASSSGIGYFYSSTTNALGTVAITTTGGQQVRGVFQNLEILAAAQLSQYTDAYGWMKVTDALDLNGFSLYVDGDFSVLGSNAGLVLNSAGWPELWVGGNATFDGRHPGTDWQRGYMFFNGDLFIGSSHTAGAFRSTGPDLHTYFSGSVPQAVRGSTTWSASPQGVASSISQLFINSTAGQTLTFEQLPALTGGLRLYSASTLVLPAGSSILRVPGYLYVAEGSNIANVQTVELAGTSEAIDLYGTFLPDMHVSGTYTTYGGTLARDLIVTGQLTKWTGTLSVGRDLLVTGPEAALRMESSGSHVLVAGRAHFDGKPLAPDSSYLRYGTLELRGDLQVDATHGGPDAPAFRPRSGSFTTLFSGTGDQRVIGAGAWSVASENLNSFQHLSVNKPTGTTLTLGGADGVQATAAVYGNLDVQSGRVAMLAAGAELQVGANIAANTAGDLSGVPILATAGAIGARTWPQIAGAWPARFYLDSGHTVTLSRPESANGAVYVFGTIDMNKQTLTANAEFQTVAGTGRLVLRDTLSTLVMNGAAMFSGADPLEDFSAGTMVFKDSVTVDVARTRAFYAASPIARVKFIGTDQVVSMNGSPDNPSGPLFRNVTVETGASVRFTNSVWVRDTLHQKGNLLVDSASVLTIGHPQFPGDTVLVLYNGSTTNTKITDISGQIYRYGACRTEPTTGATTSGNYQCQAARVVEGAVTLPRTISATPRTKGRNDQE